MRGSAMDDSEQHQLPAMSRISARRCGRINVAPVTVCGKLCERGDGVINLCVRPRGRERKRAGRGRGRRRRRLPARAFVTSSRTFARAIIYVRYIIYAATFLTVYVYMYTCRGVNPFPEIYANRCHSRLSGVSRDQSAESVFNISR